MVQIHPAMDPILLPNRQLDHRPVSKIVTNPSVFLWINALMYLTVQQLCV